MTPAAPTLVEPAYLSIPERVGSYGDEAADLAALAGRELDPEQRLAVDAMLSYGPGGRWVALEEAIIEARQNGKTSAVVLPVVLFDLFMLPPDRIVWTAHLFRTARDAFFDVDACVAATPELSRRVKNITYANGEEAVELHSGARLEFLARSKGGGRGLGGKRVVMDEALFLTAESMAALMPTLSARPDPKITYASSAGLLSSDHLRGIRDRGRAGDESVIYVEWCARTGGCTDGDRCTHAYGTSGCALDDEDNWLRANHSLGRRITPEYVRNERKTLPPVEFARERLGWWQDPPQGGGGVFDLDLWADLADIESTVPGEPIFSVDVNPERTWASIGVSGRRADELVHCAVVDHRPGCDWVRGVAETLPGRIVVLAGSPAAALDLSELNVEVLSRAEYVSACQSFHDLVTGRRMRYRPDHDLDAALASATKQNVGTEGAWCWSRKGLVDISPLVAITVAAAAATRAQNSGWMISL